MLFYCFYDFNLYTLYLCFAFYLYKHFKLDLFNFNLSSSIYTSFFINAIFPPAWFQSVSFVFLFMIMKIREHRSFFKELNVLMKLFVNFKYFALCLLRCVSLFEAVLLILWFMVLNSQCRCLSMNINCIYLEQNTIRQYLKSCFKLHICFPFL